MNALKFIKQILFFFLTFFIGGQIAYAKTELTPPQNQVVFSVEQSQSFQSLEKEVAPNIGFLKEKSKFITVSGISAVKPYNFSESFKECLADAVGSFANQIDNTIARLTSKANFSLTGTGVQSC